MKQHLPYRVNYISAFLVLSLLLGGQALACLSPSMQEMREGRSMACCAEHCRFETNDREAKNACEQSRQALTQHESLSNSSVAPGLATIKPLPDSAPLLQEKFSPFNWTHPTLQIKRHELSREFPSIKIYTFVRSFLI